MLLANWRQPKLTNNEFKRQRMSLLLNATYIFFDIQVLCCFFCDTHALHISHFVPQNKKVILYVQSQFSQNKISKCKEFEKWDTFLTLTPTEVSFVLITILREDGMSLVVVARRFNEYSIMVKSFVKAAFGR